MHVIGNILKYTCAQKCQNSERFYKDITKINGAVHKHQCWSVTAHSKKRIVINCEACKPQIV